MPGQAMRGFESVRGAAVALVFLAASGCLSPPFVGSHRPWVKSAHFAHELACGMEEEDIEAVAQRYSRLTLHRPDSFPNLLVAQRNDTRITLVLEGSRLRRYQISWTSGFTRLSSYTQQDLCNGMEYVELRIFGEPTHSGASVWLNGELLGRLSDSGYFEHDVQLGLHELRIMKNGRGTWSTELSYDSSSSGDQPLVIPSEALRNSAADAGT